MTPLANLTELSTALDQPRAFLFLWVNWTIQARTSRTVVNQVVATWAAENLAQPAPCYMADVSDQCGEVWDALASWLTLEGVPTGHLLMSGAGPLLWLRSGRVLHHALVPPQFGAAKLAAVSRDVFADAV